MEAYAGQDAVAALKHRMLPGMVTPDTPLRSCGSGVQLRGSRGSSRRDATSPPINGAASASHPNSGSTSVFPQPLCQPMPVHVLVQLLENLSSHRPPAKDSRAILHALHDYIGDAISQPELSPSRQFADEFATAGPQVDDTLPWPPATAALQPLAASTPTVGAPANGVPVNGTAMPAPTKPSHAAYLPAAVAEDTRHGCSGGSVPVATGASASLQEHIMRWSADLGILQAMYSAGFSEGEVEAFVTKLLPGLAEGVKSQLSQAGCQVRGLPGGSPAPPQSVLTGGNVASPNAPFPAGASSHASMPLNGSAAVTKESDSTAAVHTAAAAESVAAPHSDEAPVAATPVSPLRHGGTVLTDKVSPFIQRPYHLLQQLHEHAKMRCAGVSSSVSGASSGCASGRAASDVESPGSLSKQDPMQQFNGIHSESPPASPTISKPSSAIASPAPAASPKLPSAPSVDSTASLCAAHGKHTGGSSSDDSVVTGAPTSPVSASVSKHLQFAAEAQGDAGTQGSGAPALAGWRSVLDMLISAGPQAVQPAAPYVPSFAWGSGNSSTEPDTFSAKSEDPVHGGGSGDGGCPVGAAVPGTATSKSKKRRNKRSKNSSRSGA